MLTIQNLTKIYKGGIKAVDNLTLTVEKGDIFGFIGHNGAGKSTTIKAIAGVMDFDSGDITIEGLSVKSHPVECKRNIAYIPDNPDLYDNLTGIQYLNFIGDVYCVDKTQRRDLIQQYSQMFEITKNLGDLISSYSHGMKQKLALISAFIHAPKLLILDEPFVGLDPKAAHLVKEFMKDFCKKGNCIFFSTHVLDVAEKLCNKIAIIKDGKLISCGKTEEVRGDNTLENVFMELIDNEKSN